MICNPKSHLKVWKLTDPGFESCNFYTLSFLSDFPSIMDQASTHDAEQEKMNS